MHTIISTIPWKPPKEAAFHRWLPEPRVGIWVLGRYYEGREQDWSLRHLRESHSSIRHHLPQIVRELQIGDIVAPSPVEFNGHICDESELREITYVCGTTIRRGIHADGCNVLPGQTFIMSTGGCSIAVLWNKIYNTIVVAHIARDSLLAKKSVIETALEKLGFFALATAERKHASMYIALPIDPNTFTHPFDDETWGARNRERAEYIVEKWGPSPLPDWGTDDENQGRIDIAELATVQAERFGFLRCHTRAGPHTGEIKGMDDLVYDTRSSNPDFRSRRNLVGVTVLT